jgi:phage I-like protein
MADQDYATVSGQKVHRSDFAYAPQGTEPHEWKLRIDDENHVRNALARFNQTELPPEAKAAARRKILERARKYGIDTSGFEKEHATDGGSLTTNIFSRSLRVDLSQTVLRDGKELYEIPICVTGSWHKGGRKFSISRKDLIDMARNFEKRKNDMVVIDYEHASEQPEVARGGPVPAAGWIRELSANGALKALVEWTPEAREMIRSGQYRFFSPAIDWGARDKETGEPQGATLTSGALTNHPFLEELPAITLSDRELTDVSNQYLDAPLDGVSVEQIGGDNMAEDQKPRRVHLRKITEGEHAGHHHAFAGDEALGCMSEKHLAEHAAKHFNDLLSHDAFKNAAKKHLGVNPDETVSELGTETLSEARRLIDLGRATEAADLASRSRQALLSEAVRDGRIDNRKAEQLARANKITFADYIAAQEAERAIDEAVRAGKIMPRERGFFFRDALERPEEFSTLVKDMPPRVHLNAVGLGGAEAASVDEEVQAETRRLMSERKLAYSAALKEALRANPQLAEQYRRQHSRQIGGEAAN